MALFQYEALSDLGKKVQGVVTADTMILAKEKLSQDSFFVTKISQKGQSSRALLLSEAQRLNFTRDLAQLLRAGLPLFESLLAIEEKYRTAKSHLVFADLCEKVKNGMHLSKALSYYPKSFDQIYVAMVSSAEETGSLAEVFSELEKLSVRQAKLKKQLTSAMMYPIFLLSFCFLVVCALFFFLIPSMQQLFEGREVHPLTKAIIGCTEFLNTNLTMIASSLIIFCLGFIFLLSRKTTKILWKRLLLKIGFFKRLVTATVLSRFCRALSVMISSSVPMVEALAYSRKIMKHELFESVIEEAEQAIIQGQKLSEVLSKSVLFPPLSIRMISIAEETGRLSEMLKNIASIYEEELEKSLARITTLLPPVILLFLAMVVGVVVISILLPLTDVGSFLN